MPETSFPSAQPLKTKQKKTPWSAAEITAVKKHLGGCIQMNRVPRKHEALKAICSDPALKRRKWNNVKDFVYNLLKKQRLQ